MTMDLSLNIEGESSGAQQALAQVQSSLDDMKGSIDGIDSAPLEAAQAALDGVATAGADAQQGGLDAQQGAEEAYASIGNLGTISDEVAGQLEDVNTAGGDAAGGLSDAASAADDAGMGLSSAAGAADQAESGFSGASSGATDLVGSIGGLDSSLGPVTSGITDMVGALGDGEAGLWGVAAAAVGATAGLGMMGANWATEQMQLQDMLGMTGEQTEFLSNMFSDAAVSTSTLQTAAFMLERRLVSVSLAAKDGKTTSNSLTQALDELGVKYLDANGDMIPMATLLPDILNSLGAMDDKNRAVELSTQLFGRAGKQLAPVIDNYNTLMATAAEQTNNSSLSQANATDLAIKYHKATTDLGIKMNELGVEVLPVLTDAIGAAAWGISHLGDLVNILGWVYFPALRLAIDPAKDAFGFLQDVMGDIADVTAPELTAAFGVAQGAIGDIETFVGNLRDDVSGLIGDIGDLIDKLDSIPSPGDILGGIGGAIGGALGDVGNAIPFHAIGGPSSGLTWVGENGPELIESPPDSYIHSNAESRAMVEQGGGGPSTVIYNYGHVHNNFPTGDAARTATREIDRLFRGA